jgi:hypothetical protein
VLAFVAALLFGATALAQFPPTLVAQTRAARLDSVQTLVEDNDVYVVIQEGHVTRFSASHDDGATFDVPVTFPGTCPVMAADWTCVFVCFLHDGALECAASADSGRTFVTRTVSDTQNVQASSVTLAAAGSHAYAAWQSTGANPGVFVDHAVGTGPWGPDFLVAASGDARARPMVSAVAIGLNASRAGVVTAITNSIVYCEATDIGAGATFTVSSPVQGFDVGTGALANASVALYGGAAFFGVILPGDAFATFWAPAVPPLPPRLFGIAARGSSTFSSPVLIGSDVSSVSRPALAVERGFLTSVAITAFTTTAGQVVTGRCTSDAGWTTGPVLDSGFARSATDPTPVALSAASGRYYATWIGRDQATGLVHVLYARSDDLGVTFGAPQVLETSGQTPLAVGPSIDSNGYKCDVAFVTTSNMAAEVWSQRVCGWRRIPMAGASMPAIALGAPTLGSNVILLANADEMPLQPPPPLFGGWLQSLAFTAPGVAFPCGNGTMVDLVASSLAPVTQGFAYHGLLECYLSVPNSPYLVGTDLFFQAFAYNNSPCGFAVSDTLWLRLTR